MIDCPRSACDRDRVDGAVQLLRARSILRGIRWYDYPVLCNAEYNRIVLNEN